MTPARSRWSRAALGVLVACGFLWLTLRQQDLGSVLTSIASIPVVPLAAAVLFLALGYAFRVLRWWLMLHTFDPHITVARCVRPLLVSVAVNNLVPLRAGDALRVVGFRTELAANPGRLLGTLVAERVLDLAVLLVAFFIGSTGVHAGAIAPRYVRGCGVVAALAAVAWLLALAFGPRIAAMLSRFLKQERFAAKAWAQKTYTHLGHFLESLQVLRRPKLTSLLLAASLAAWLFEGAVFASVAYALDYHGLLLGPWFALATGTLATLIPGSPGYVGTFDYFARLGLGAYGADSTLATAFALVVHAVLWLPLTFAGALMAVSGPRPAVASPSAPAP